jgi:NADH-quinone oxidoreductase subunit J
MSAALLLAGLGLLAVRGRLGAGPPAGHAAVGSSLKLYAYQLFTTYLLPVQVMGFLLLIAMLGVIVISRRMGEAEDPR